MEQVMTDVEFEIIHPTIVQDLLQHAENLGLSGQALQRFKETLEYNTLGGKYNRGRSVPDICAIVFGRVLEPEEMFKATLLGWCIELLQAFFLVTDDMIDCSMMRRNQQSWYQKDGVGMLAINDACMLHSSIFILLDKYFRYDPTVYCSLVQLFLDVSFRTQMGQSCDTVISTEDLQSYTMDTYKSIVVLKTTYYTFYLPVAVALALCGQSSDKNLSTCMDILCLVGEYFQVQDDYFDCFAPPDVLGKIGTDIRDRKCSWLFVTALESGDTTQITSLCEFYGKDDKHSEESVKKLYSQLKMEHRFLGFMEEQRHCIRNKISCLNPQTGLKREIFESIFAKIENRIK